MNGHYEIGVDPGTETGVVITQLIDGERWVVVGNTIRRRDSESRFDAVGTERFLQRVAQQILDLLTRYVPVDARLDSYIEGVTRTDTRTANGLSGNALVQELVKIMNLAVEVDDAQMVYARMGGKLPNCIVVKPGGRGKRRAPNYPDLLTGRTPKDWPKNEGADRSHQWEAWEVIVDGAKIRGTVDGNRAGSLERAVAKLAPVLATQPELTPDVIAALARKQLRYGTPEQRADLGVAAALALRPEMDAAVLRRKLLASLAPRAA